LQQDSYVPSHLCSYTRTKDANKASRAPCCCQGFFLLIFSGKQTCEGRTDLDVQLTQKHNRSNPKPMPGS